MESSQGGVHVRERRLGTGLGIRVQVQRLAAGDRRIRRCRVAFGRAQAPLPLVLLGIGQRTSCRGTSRYRVGVGGRHRLAVVDDALCLLVHGI